MSPVDIVGIAIAATGILLMPFRMRWLAKVNNVFKVSRKGQVFFTTTAEELLSRSSSGFRWWGGWQIDWQTHESEYAMNSVSAPETLSPLPKPDGCDRRSVFAIGVIVILSTVLIGARLPETPEEIIHLSVGKPVMVDGNLEPGEWSDAAEVKMPNDARLYLKVSGEFVYVAVQLPASRSGFTDLYIASARGSIYDLHASAKLGQRQLLNDRWPEWDHWWNNQGWVANLSRVDSFEKRTFLPANVREYQIKRSRFPGHEWRLMVDMSLESKGGEYTVARFPPAASGSNPEKWLRVQIER